MQVGRLGAGWAVALSSVLWLCQGAMAATPTVPVEAIPPTPEDLLSARPGADGLIRNGDESTVERVFVYLDGCPLMELARPVAGTGHPEMVMLADAASRCIPLRGASAGVAPGLMDGTAGLAEDTGLHVRLFREQSSSAARTDVERLISPEGQNLIVEITTVDPQAIEIMARGGAGPAGPAGAQAFAIPPLPGEPGAGDGGTGATSARVSAGGPALAWSRGGGGGRDVRRGDPQPIRVSALEPPRPDRPGDPGRTRVNGVTEPRFGAVSAVPLPAGLGLLATALVGLGLLTRRLRRRPRKALRALRGGAAVSV